MPSGIDATNQDNATAPDARPGQRDGPDQQQYSQGAVDQPYAQHGVANRRTDQRAHHRVVDRRVVPGQRVGIRDRQVPVTGAIRGPLGIPGEARIDPWCIPGQDIFPWVQYRLAMWKSSSGWPRRATSPPMPPTNPQSATAATPAASMGQRGAVPHCLPVLLIYGS